MRNFKPNERRRLTADLRNDRCCRHFSTELSGFDRTNRDSPEDVWERPKGSDPSLGNLGVGEREAILIAEEIRADQLIMDDQRGRREARKRGIQAVGTLSVLQAAARAGLLDLSTALERLQRTNFFMSPRLVAETLKGEPPEKK